MLRILNIIYILKSFTHNMSEEFGSHNSLFLWKVSFLNLKYIYIYFRLCYREMGNLWYGSRQAPVNTLSLMHKIQLRSSTHRRRLVFLRRFDAYLSQLSKEVKSGSNRRHNDRNISWIFMSYFVRAYKRVSSTLNCLNGILSIN